MTGPGFRFICSNCSRNSGVPETHNSGIFLLEVSTTTKKWRIHLDTIPRWWFHFAFTWSPNQGLKYYKNGKFVLGKKNPERFMVATDTKHCQNDHYWSSEFTKGYVKKKQSWQVQLRTSGYLDSRSVKI